MTDKEITLNGEIYVLKKELKKEKKEEFRYDTQLKIIKILESMGYAIQDELLDLSDNIAITDPANICLIQALTPKARNILIYFAKNGNLKENYNYQEFWDKQDTYLGRFSYSNEYLKKSLQFLSLTCEATEIKCKEKAYPLTLENPNFRIILAPRVYEDEGGINKLFGLKE